MNTAADAACYIESSRGERGSYGIMQPHHAKKLRLNKIPNH
jgi:hypothetical protein